MNTTPGRTLIGAAVAFTVALFLFGSALLRAFSTNPVLLPPPAPAPAAADGDPAENRSLSADALRLAVENDPFTPERQAPAERYRLPGDVDPEPPPPPPMPPPPPAFEVSGTVVTENVSMALISVGDVPPRMMSIGESLMGYRLSGVTAETATMSNEESDIVLRVPAPSRQAAVATTRGQQRGSAQNRSATNPAQQAAAMRQVIERARAAGATPQMLEAIMRMVSERGIDAIENLEIGPNGFTIRGDGSTRTMRFETAPSRAPTPPPPGARTRVRPDTTELRMPRAPDLR